MLIDAFPVLKSILQPAYRTFRSVLPSLSNSYLPRFTRSEIHNHKSRGFTLIELVMVIVLIGILAVYAAPKLGNISSTKAGAFRAKLRADIRYAQDLAMTRNQRYRVYFNNANPPGPPVPAIPANGYGVVYDTSAAQNWSSTAYANDPASGGTLRVDLSTGDFVGITLASAPTNSIEFNSLGMPTGGTATVSINPGSYQITIAAQTGAVN